MNVFERTLRKADAAQQRHTVSAAIFGLMKKYGDDNAGSLAVQLTYSMFLTIFPLLLLLVTILGIVLANNAADRQRVLNSAFGEFPIVGQSLAKNVHALKRSSVVGLIVGLLGLLYGTTGLAQSGLYAMEQIWNIPSAIRPNYITRMKRSLLFITVLAIGLVVTTALSGFGTFGKHNFWLGVAGEIVAGIVNIAVYVAVFRVLTPKQIATSLLWRGAALAGVLWTVLQAFGGYVVGHDLKGSSAVYGLFGLVLGLIAWIYLAVEMTLYCAELNTVLHLRLWPRGMIQPPLTDADQRSLARQAIQNQRRPEQLVTTSFDSRPMTQDQYRENEYALDKSQPGVSSRSPE